MVRDQVSVLLLDESCDHIFDVEGECLSLFLRKHQENRGIPEIQHFLDRSQLSPLFQLDIIYLSLIQQTLELLLNDKLRDRHPRQS